MLTTDMVRVRRRQGTIAARPLSDAERARLVEVAAAFVEHAGACVGKTRGELESLLDNVPHRATDYKLVRGLRKLLLDRCSFELRDDLEPAALRRAVFARAAETRRGLDDGDSFDRDAVLDVIAGERNMSRAAVDDALFADLKENYRITAFRTVAAPGLVDGYETAQNQAVLLRATSVTVKLQCPDADGYRAFFRALKFRRLLYRLAREPDARYRIDIDGPFSLFQAVTKYGLQLALMLPALERAGEWELEADVRWGKKREPLRFELSGSANRARAGEAPPLPDEVAVLRERFAALDTEWSVEVADEVLDLPGEGLCVPDLAFTHEPSGACAYLEVMGYWSRDAVWRRVELVEAGLPHHIIFAVSSRLRVSEEVLDGDLPGQLYVYKGVISARAVHERLERLIGSDTPNTG